MTVPMLSDMVVICCNWKPLSALPVYHIRIVGWSCVIVPVCCQVERPQRPSEGSPKFRGRPWNWRHDFEILNMSEVQNELPDTVCVYIYIMQFQLRACCVYQTNPKNIKDRDASESLASGSSLWTFWFLNHVICQPQWQKKQILAQLGTLETTASPLATISKKSGHKLLLCASVTTNIYQLIYTIFQPWDTHQFAHSLLHLQGSTGELLRGE